MKLLWKYLDMMTELCEKEGIELLLIKAPSLYPYWYDEYEAQVEDYAAAHNLRYIKDLFRQIVMKNLLGSNS